MIMADDGSRTRPSFGRTAPLLAPTWARLPRSQAPARQVPSYRVATRRGGIEIGADEVAPLLGIEPRGDAGRIPDRAKHIATDLENDKVRAKSLFATLNLPQDPDGLRVSDQGGNEVFFRTRRQVIASGRKAIVNATNDTLLF
jgi:hypothetical protein